ncbi:TlpA disulfide reductase family protein [Kordia algicida OT-1]|uniref:Thioredoxin family protein n=1 Tax=Kordia algicida OT-1 TaxID=391587 RepID=A9E3Q6_9FLAO|nr:TlpA disulfide reductase family protein [Kordia algicida]EDP95254.1 thioredoxin family protein [Kordia algicida OT-1]
MKKLLLLVAAFAIFSCENEPEVPKDYVTFSGTIKNKKSDSLYIRSRTYSKTIKVNDDGTFKDTLKVEAGVFSVFDGKDGTSAYLKNDYDVVLSADAENYMKSAKFSGKGAENSNFLAESRRKSEKMLDIDKLSSLAPDELNNRLDEIKTELTTYFKSQKNVDSLLIANSLQDINPMINYYKGFIGKISAIKRKFPKGTPSPTFDYENHKGGKTSLADLKGKYVYIDIWATWCGPCIAQIPALKKVEEEYKDKNIVFVSISVDQNRDAWEKMVTEKSLGGIQLHFGGDQTFSNEYMISGIPRFILLDTEGKVVNPDAPRPSSPKLVELFDELKI